MIVVDDRSTDGTAQAAVARAPRPDTGGGGNPAAARNRGPRRPPAIRCVLDSDCIPADGWLAALLAAHERGATVVGAHSIRRRASGERPLRLLLGCTGSFQRPAGRTDHPPPNLSVRRAAFFATSGFTERQPLSYTNKEREWQAELQRAGHLMYFEPKAIAYHYNRPGFANLLRRNYRWAYTAIESKSQTGATRYPWLFRHPRLLIAGSLPLAFLHTAFILGCWVRAGRFEPVLMAPAVFASRLAYSAGMAAGGLKWLRRRNTPTTYQPRWQ